MKGSLELQSIIMQKTSQLKLHKLFFIIRVKQYTETQVPGQRIILNSISEKAFSFGGFQNDQCCPAPGAKGESLMSQANAE